MFTIPTTFAIAHVRVRMLHSRGTGCSICDLSWIIATRQLVQSARAVLCVRGTPSARTLRFRLRVRDIQTKWITFRSIANPTFHFTLVHTGYSVFSWTAFINLRRELLHMNGKVNIIKVAPGEHHGVWNQRQLNCLLNSQFKLTTKKYPRFALLFLYGEQNNTRLYRVAMVAIFNTVLCGTNTSDHVKGTAHLKQHSF